MNKKRKRILSVCLTLCILITTSMTTMAAQPRLSQKYWHQVAQVVQSNYIQAFSVPGKVPNQTQREIYISGGAKFTDGIVRDLTVRVGSESFTLRADGSTTLRKTMKISTEIPIIIEVKNIDSQCLLVLDVYTLD